MSCLLANLSSLTSTNSPISSVIPATTLSVCLKHGLNSAFQIQWYVCQVFRWSDAIELAKIGIYILDTFRVSVFEHLNGMGDGRPEYIIAKVLLQGSFRLLLATVYRPPNAGYQEFFKLFLKRQVDYIHSIILGDFNADTTALIIYIVII